MKKNLIEQDPQNRGEFEKQTKGMSPDIKKKME